MFITTIILIMASGIFIGYRLRNRITWSIGRITTGFIWLLLFLLGLEVGGNPTLIKGLYKFGGEAFLLMIAGVSGCIITSWTLWYYISESNKKDKK